MTRPVSVLLVLLLTCTVVSAQTTRKPATSSTVKALDAQAQKAQQDFLKNLAKLAGDYEKAGQMQKAAEMLRAMQKIEPSGAIEAKLKELREHVFDENQREVEIDPSKSWQSSGVAVTKGKSVRLQATGEYRLMLNEQLTAAGLPVGDAVGKNELSAAVHCGRLMGVVLPAQRLSGNRRNQQPADFKPFAVGQQVELEPEEDGVLFLRVNVPPGANCNGKLKVTISGNFRPL